MQKDSSYSARCAQPTASKQVFDFLQAHSHCLVITGAGLSTGSGIPDYRDHQGQWKRPPPVKHQDFMGQLGVRQRYWARALVGFERFRAAQPNPAHRALAALEKRGWIQQIITQNVDRLHQKAGSQGVIELHGRGDTVSCQSCGFKRMRYAYHQELAALNPRFSQLTGRQAPDGDADLEDDDFSDFQVARCPRCAGVIKPDVVFFGDLVPQATRQAAEQAIHQADAVLILGSSLMVYSGFRLCRMAKQAGKALGAVNLGATRADPLLDFKLARPVDEVLAGLIPA